MNYYSYIVSDEKEVCVGVIQSYSEENAKDILRSMKYYGRFENIEIEKIELDENNIFESYCDLHDDFQI